jgi:hypothetical protein
MRLGGPNGTAKAKQSYLKRNKQASQGRKQIRAN